MNPSQYLYQVITGSFRYYEYLQKTGKGREVVTVYSIVEKRGLFELRLTKRLFDPNLIEFRVYNQVFTIEQLRIYGYDKQNNILTVFPADEYKDVLDGVPAEAVTVESDLSFLVKRVGNWYSTKAEEGWYPAFQNKMKFTAEILTSDSKYVPSAEQEAAMRMAMSEPLSYVWGAPGTGKTQYVLARCIVNYIRADRLVVVSAPTNFALEQVLFGVMKVLDAEKISTDKVLRLGAPSIKFRDMYPKSCELGGVAQEIIELTDRKTKLIADLHKIGLYQKLKERHEYGLNAKEQLADIHSEYKLIEEEKNEIIRSINDKRNEIRSIQIAKAKSGMERDAVEKRINRLSLEKRKIKYSFSKFVGSQYSKDVDRRFDTAILESDRISVDIQEYEKQIDEQEKELNRLFVKSEDRCKEYALISLLKKTVLFSEKLYDAVANVTYANLYAVILEVERIVNDGNAELEKRLKEYAEYETISANDIESELDNINTRIAELEELKTENRLDEVNVIAATADAFISRYDLFVSEKILYRLSHVFIDEAGYLCLAKGIPFFSLDVPVTLLGDHMQIPPVCELTIDKMKEDYYKPALYWTIPIIYCVNLEQHTIDSLYDCFTENTLPIFKNYPKAELNITYRFGKNLASILAKNIYSENFVSASENDVTEIFVLDAPKMRESEKRTNHAEAKAIYEFLTASRFEDVIVMTPYKNQRVLLTDTLPKEEFASQNKIITVHASQGQEWETVVFSATDTTDMWFTDSLDPKRGGKAVLNTALSRAKKRLVIACDKNFWEGQAKQLLGQIVNCADVVIDTNFP